MSTMPNKKIGRANAARIEIIEGTSLLALVTRNKRNGKPSLTWPGDEGHDFEQARLL